MKMITNQQDAEALAIDALLFLTQDSELLSRFLDLTGISAGQIRQAAATPEFLAGVLQFFLSHEPTLIKFSDYSEHRPQTIEKAFTLLPGGSFMQ